MVVNIIISDSLYSVHSPLIGFGLYACLYRTQPESPIAATIWTEQGHGRGGTQSSGFKTIEQIETLDT